MTISGGALTGQWLGDYQLQGILGIGGMAEVYQARDAVINREVAVKVLPLTLAADPSYVERFRNEAQAVGALNHPNIVPVHSFGEQGPLLYLVMPLMKESLRDRLLRSAPLSVEEGVQIAVQILSGLGAAHAHGVVHRDVKPENILLDENGVAKLTDFGIARRITIQRGSGGPTLAGTGLPVGTPQYMAPEQLRGEDLDQRADIYSLGSVLYEMLTGLPPHIADTPYEVASLVLTAPVTPPAQRNPLIWPELEQVMLRALGRKPSDRYANATSFAEALQDALLAHEIELIEPASAIRSSYVKFRTSQPLAKSANATAPGNGALAGNGALLGNGALSGPPTQGAAWSGAPHQDPAEPPTVRLSTTPPSAPPGNPPRWPPSNQPRGDDAGDGGRGRRLLIIGLIAAIVLLATCGAGVFSLNLLNSGGTTPAQNTPTATVDVPATNTPELPTSTATATLEPTNTPKPNPTATATATNTPTPASLNVSRVSLDAGTCASPSYGSVTVSNTGQTPLNWTTTSDDVAVSASPSSGNGVTQSSPQSVTFTGAPTSATVHVTFTNSANLSNQKTVTITCE